eukprot:scaffold7353_cov87-Cylindrotheca_fusiformis.AAC.3
MEAAHLDFHHYYLNLFWMVSIAAKREGRQQNHEGGPDDTLMDSRTFPGNPISSYAPHGQIDCRFFIISLASFKEMSNGN